MKKVLKIVGNVIIWMVVLLAALITILVFTSTNHDGIPNLFGRSLFSIQSESMVPTIQKGDLILDEEITDYQTLQEGDIITFWTRVENERILNTHRIQSMKKDDNGVPYEFVTKGDNNPVADVQVVSSADIVGRYRSRIGGLGTVLDFLKTQKGFFICVILPLILFFLYQLICFVRTLLDYKHFQHRSLTKEEEEELKKKAVEEYLAEQKEKQE